MAYINKYGDKYNSNWYSAGYNYDDIDRKYFNGLNNLNSYTYDEWKTYKKLDNLTYTPEYWEPKIDKKMNKDLKKVVKDNGTVEYYNDNDKLHNLNGPAIEYSNGDKSWYKNGERHRENGPAIEWSNINEYYLNNILYSKDEYYQKVKKTYLNNKQNSKIKSTKPLNVDNGKLTEDEIFFVNFIGDKIKYNKTKDIYYINNKKENDNIENSTEPKEETKTSKFKSVLSAIFPFGLFTNRISLSTQTESKQELVTVPKRAKQIIDAKVELDKLNTLSKYFDYYLLNNIHKHSKYIIDTFCSDFEKVEHEHKLNVVNLVQFNYYYTEHINDFLSELKVSIKTNRTNFNSELNIKEDKLTEYKKELKEKNTRGLKTKIKNIEKDIKTLNSNIENIVYNTINSNKEMLQKYLEKIENFNVNPNSDNKLKDSKNSLNYIINNEMLKI